MKVAILSASHEVHSRSRTAALAAARILGELELPVEIAFIDLDQIGVDAYPGPEEHPERDAAVALFEGSDAVIVTSPVHNWGAAASTHAFLAHALDPDDGRRFRPAVILGGAGSSRSLLALDGLVRTLQTEQDFILIGKSLIFSGDDVDKIDGTLSDGASRRLKSALTVFAKVAAALSEDIRS